MIKREEVEEMLIGCGEPPLNTKDDLCLVPATTLAELARTWLAVDSSPVVELDTTHTPFGIVLAAVVDDQPGTWTTGMKVRVIREQGDQP